MSVFFLVDIRTAIWATKHIKKGDLIFSTTKVIQETLYRCGIESCLLPFNPNKIYNPKEFIKANQFYNNILRYIQNKKIYVFNISYTLLLFWILKRLSRKNTIIFKLSKDIYRDSNIICRLWKYEIIKWGKFLVPRISYNYLKNRAIWRDDYEKRISPIYECSSKNILLLSDFPLNGFTDKKTFTLELNQIYNTIKHLDLAIKAHPNEPKIYGDLQQGVILPSEIPFELINTKNFKNVIGILSTSLIDSANAGINTISLANLITMDLGTKIEFVEWLVKASGNKIKFPRSIDELWKCLEY